MAGHGAGELEFSTVTKPQDVQGNRIPNAVVKSVEISLHDLERECDLQFTSKSAHTSLCKTDGAWSGHQ